VHMAVLALLYPAVTATFWQGQAAATLTAMTGNFLLNNALTYRDQRLKGAGAMLKGWIGFCLTCAVGGFANVAVATLLEMQGLAWFIAALAGILVGSVWNYALSSRFVWGRY
jgi:dolichol-phosphate mannosyltransferase